MNELILTGEKILPYHHACTHTTKAYDSVTISKAADSMLAMSEVETTFVIACNQKWDCLILHRSRSKNQCTAYHGTAWKEVISIQQPLKWGSKFDGIRQQLIETLLKTVTIERRM